MLKSLATVAIVMAVMHGAHAEDTCTAIFSDATAVLGEEVGTGVANGDQCFYFAKNHGVVQLSIESAASSETLVRDLENSGTSVLHMMPMDTGDPVWFWRDAADNGVCIMTVSGSRLVRVKANDSLRPDPRRAMAQMVEHVLHRDDKKLNSRNFARKI